MHVQGDSGDTRQIAGFQRLQLRLERGAWRKIALHDWHSYQGVRLNPRYDVWVRTISVACRRGLGETRRRRQARDRIERQRTVLGPVVERREVWLCGEAAMKLSASITPMHCLPRNRL